MVRRVTCRGPVWRCADQVQIKFASAKALAAVVLFLIPILSIIYPCGSRPPHICRTGQLRLDFDQADAIAGFR